MMNLTARMPSVVSSSTSSSPGKTWYGYQDPGKSVASDDRSGKPEKTSWDMMQKVAPHREEPLLDGNAHSVRYGEMIHDGSGKPEKVNSQEEASSENFVMGGDAAEFVNKVKEQVRSRQKRMSNVAESGEEHSIIWGMFMAATMNAATFMGKNFSTIQSVVKNYEDLTLKQMFDVTAQLVNDQEEIHGLDKIQWEKNSWKRLSLIGDATVINLQRTKVYVFSDSVLCLGRVHQHPESNEAWKKRIQGVMSEKSYRDYDGINGEPTEFEWNIFPGFTTLQLCGKINDLLSDLGQKPETFTGRIIFMSMFNDISCDRKGNKDECLANAGVVKVLARRFGVGQWSFIGPGSEKKWYSAENSPQGAWDNIAEEMLLEFAESGHPTFRATTPLSRGILKSKGHGELSIHFAADEQTIETIFRIIISVNQLSIYGAVAVICEEFENHQDRSGEPEVLMGQSIVLGEIKAEVPLQNENYSNHRILWQQYMEQIESLSQESKVSRFCMEAGFMRVVEVEQSSTLLPWCKFSMLLCRRWKISFGRSAGSWTPRCSRDSIQQRLVDRDLRHSQMAEQLVEVPQFEQFASLLAEQIVDIPVPGGSLHDYLLVPGLAALSAVLRDEPGTKVRQRTKIIRAPCRRRIGRVVLRAANFGDLITADDKVVSEGCESRNNHRYAIVVQDLATQWLQSYP